MGVGHGCLYVKAVVCDSYGFVVTDLCILNRSDV
jgi:hypothetical protein